MYKTALPEYCSLVVALPQSDRLVVLQRRRRDDVARGMTVRAENHVSVTLQFLHYLLRLQIPQNHAMVLGARDDPLNREDE